MPELQTIAEVLLFVSETPVTLDSLKEYIREWTGTNGKRYLNPWQKITRNAQEAYVSVSSRRIRDGDTTCLRCPDQAIPETERKKD